MRVVPFSPELSEDARSIRNEAFADHWGSTETSAEAWEHHVTGSTFRPGFSFVAYAGQEPAGFILSEEYEAYNEVAGGRDLFIDLSARAARPAGGASPRLC